MPSSILAILMTAVIAIALANMSVTGQAPENPRPTFLSALTKGQSVVLKEAAGRFEISMFDEEIEPLSHKVVEVQADYLIIEDFGGVTETRLPIYSIKSVVRLKSPKK